MRTMKCTCRHNDHGHIDHAGYSKSNYNFAVGIAHKLAAILVALDFGTCLREAGVEVKRMRHNGGTDNTDGNKQGVGIRHFRCEKMQPRSFPINRCDHHFNKITKADNRNQNTDQNFRRAETAAINHQKRISNNRGNNHTDDQRQIEQQGKTDSTTEEFGKVGCHCSDFADNPHCHNNRF